MRTMNLLLTKLLLLGALCILGCSGRAARHTRRNGTARKAVSTIESVKHGSHIVAGHEGISVSLVHLSDIDFLEGIPIRNHIFRIVPQTKGRVKICSVEFEGLCLGLAKAHDSEARSDEIGLVDIDSWAVINFVLDIRIIHREGQKTVTLHVNHGTTGDQYLCTAKRHRFRNQGRSLVLSEEAEAGDLKRRKACQFRVSDFYRRRK